MVRTKKSRTRRTDGLVAMSDVWVLKLSAELRDQWRRLDEKASEYRDTELAAIAERLLVMSEAIL